ncbi:hypothetical protein CMI37_30915 [Candidatus Pacearchaeota archaeon]|nr:hypothetical protein [Candidatus Pacearchaeota archaeon]|tara:strand:+ start:1666 stop:3126 length:1461 start_codon:yes stop_codon:yes gene_type:complete
MSGLDIFAKLSETEITRNFLKVKWDAENARMEEAAEKMDLYMDDYEDIIKAKMIELFHPDNYSRLKYHVNQTQNILKRVINEISTIYKVQASRMTDPEDLRYSEILKDFNLDLKMRRANRYTNLLNESFIKIGVRNGGIAYDLITPNISMVVQNLFDPTQIDAIIYTTSLVNTSSNSDVLYYYWDINGNYFIMDKNWKVMRAIYGDGGELGEISPYKDDGGNIMLPFVTLHRQEPDFNFFDQDTGRDLYNAAILTGVKFTQFDYMFKTASFKQMYAVGDELQIPEGQVLDPVTMLRVSGEGAAVGTLDMVAPLDKLQAALEFQINSVVANYGISSDQWNLKVSDISGRALKIKNRPLMEIRQEQIPVYRNIEKDLFRKTRIINNIHAGAMKWKKIDESTEFSVDFGEIDFPEQPEEELKLFLQKIQAGVMTLGQLGLKYNPDLKTEEKGEGWVIGNLKDLAATKTQNPEIEDMMNSILEQEESPSS